MHIANAVSLAQAFIFAPIDDDANIHMGTWGFSLGEAKQGNLYS